MEKSSHRAVIQYLQKKGLTPKDIHRDMVATLGTDAPAYTTVKKWAAAFKRGRESLNDAPRSGRPPSATTSDFVDQVHELVKSDQRVTIRHITGVVGISSERIHHILTIILALSKISSRWVQSFLKPDEMHVRFITSRDNLRRFESNPTDFMARFITVDEIWTRHFHVGSRQQSDQSKPSSSPSKQVETSSSADKVMASVFWDADGILMVEYLKKDQALTAHYYAILMAQLRNKIEAKRTGKLEKGVLFLWDGSPHRKTAVVVRAVNRCGFQLLDHPPNSPDLAPSDFHLFPNLKKHMAGVQYATDNDLMAAVEDFLLTKDPAFFSEGIEELQHRWRRCIDVQGDYIDNRRKCIDLQGNYIDKWYVTSRATEAVAL